MHACTTTRLGGVSVAPYDSLNLGDHVGDMPLAVARNRQRVGEKLQLPAEPLWLEQVHGTVVADTGAAACQPRADASVSRHARQVCVVMTADCLPVLFCDREGTRVAAAHAGWRGLCDGVLEQTVHSLQCDPAYLLAWLGPAIGPAAFEVGDEVRTAFMARNPAAAEAFVPGVAPGKWWCDIYHLARQRLTAAGMKTDDISGGKFCTVAEAGRFFSYRRDGVTGRMASLIWLD
ncbi:MAG: peptidoglycan editing factor PgeF [Thiothrix sp.]|nr:peptidoglycan editing factor PgeF [Thiothrix sp.]